MYVLCIYVIMIGISGSIAVISVLTFFILREEVVDSLEGSKAARIIITEHHFVQKPEAYRQFYEYREPESSFFGYGFWGGISQYLAS